VFAGNVFKKGGGYTDYAGLVPTDRLEEIVDENEWSDVCGIANDQSLAEVAEWDTSTNAQRRSHKVFKVLVLGWDDKGLEKLEEKYSDTEAGQPVKISTCLSP